MFVVVRNIEEEAAAGVKYDEWLAFATPIDFGLLGLGAAAIVAAILIGI